MEPNLEDILTLPLVDPPVASLSSNSVLPMDLIEGLKVEKACHKTHQATIWAIKASTSASFFNRASILWLHKLQSRLPAGDTRLHQNVTEIIAAVQYSVDASLNAAKFASRAWSPT